MGSSKPIRPKDRKDHRLPVDPDKLNMGNSYASPPEYYYDQEFDCSDCGVHQVWTAKQQKWWYEQAGGYFFATAIRCRACRKKEHDRKAQARNQAGHSDKPDG